QRALADRELRRRKARGARAPQIAGYRRRMSGHVLILNAGSSSLKFRVYELGDSTDGWNVAAGGQIEGIGTAPHLHAKDGAGNALADEKLAEKSDARAALDALAKWL